MKKCPNCSAVMAEEASGCPACSRTEKEKFMLYALIVLGSCGLLCFSIMVFIVPKFARIFAGFGASLPLDTDILIKVSAGIRGHAVLCAAAAFCLLFGLGVMYSTPRGRERLEGVVGDIPISSFDRWVIVLMLLFLGFVTAALFSPMFTVSELSSINGVAKPEPPPFFWRGLVYLYVLMGIGYSIGKWPRLGLWLLPVILVGGYLNLKLTLVVMIPTTVPLLLLGFLAAAKRTLGLTCKESETPYCLR